jgi:FkbM family methyltransferase
VAAGVGGPPEAPPEQRGERRRGKLLRAAFLAEAAQLTPYVAARCRGGDELFVVATADEGVGRRLFVTGWREDLTVLARACRLLEERGVRRPPGAVFVDVGANIGTTTVVALRRHGFATAVAIEPSPDNHRLLGLNVAANDLGERVRVVCAAASDREGRLELDSARPNSGAHRVARAAAGRPAGPLAPVPAVTLDRLVEDGTIDLDCAGMLWVDVVGHEPEALAGASRLLEAGVPLVVAVKPWRKARVELPPAVAAHYTEIVDLRHRRGTRPAAELGALIGSIGRTTDLLLLRR